MAERIRNMLAQDPNMYHPMFLKKDTHQGRIGRIPGIEVGKTFKTKDELYDTGMHKVKHAGIWGTKEYGAYSIVVEGVHAEEEDYGETIVFTGAGGRSSHRHSFACQTVDQSFSHPDNASLMRSKETHNPVRVIRGVNKMSPYAPIEGYRYDGEYYVEDAQLVEGKSVSAIDGKRKLFVCQFFLRREKGLPALLMA